MAKTNTELQALEEAQSRNEQFLDYLCGRATDLNALPKPESRVEELLEFLCYNGGIGGGSGQPLDPKTVINAELDGDILKFTHLDNTVTEVPLDDFVREWKDLDYVEEYNDVNLMEYNKKVTGYRYGAGDAYVEDADWSTYFLDVKPNEQYSIMRRVDDNNRFVFTNSVGGSKIDATNVNTVHQSNGFFIRSLTVPNRNNITKLAIQFKHNENTINDIMILEGVHTTVDKFIPYADKQTIQIGREVSYAFDNEGTTLKSTTVESAIKELSEKISEDILPITNYQPINKFNGKEMVLGRRYDTNGDIVSDAYYGTYTYPCTAGQTFTIAKRVHDDDRCVYLTEDNQIVQVSTIPRFTRNEIVHYRVTVPNDVTIAKIGFNIKTTVNTTQVMIFDGHNDLPVGALFTPYLAEKLIDGDKILHSFNNVGTNLSSSTTKEAIEELALSKVDKHITPFNRFNSYRDFTAKYYRIPSLLATNNGTLLSFADIRYNTAKDQSFIDIGVARSIDDGTVWNNAIAMKNNRVSNTESRVMDTTSVVTSTGKIIVLAGGWDSGTSNWTQSTQTPTDAWNPFIVTSTDDGLTWSDKVSLKNSVNGLPQDTVAWLGGVGTGIVKKKGTNINRIVMPIQICVRGNNSNTVKAGCIYSDDDGATWTMSRTFAENGTSENMIAEIGNGNLIMIARRDSYGSKAAYFSTNGGETWELHRTLSGAFTHGTVSCQGSWITLEVNGQTIGLLSHPKNTSNSYQRDNITIYMYNFDDPNPRVTELYTVYPYLGNASGAGYSSLCYYKNINGVYKLAISFETNGNIEFKDISEVLGIIEKTQGTTVTGGVTSVNGQLPNQGAVTINASQINMLNGTSIETSINSKADASILNDNVTRIDSKLLELSNFKVDKYTPSIANDLTVENLNITGSPIVISRSSTSAGVAGTKTLAGDKNASIPQGTKVSKILVGVNGYTEGETVTGVEVYAVNKANDTIVERIVYEGTGVARIPRGYEADGVFYVDVEVNKSFSVEVYFITRLKKNGSKGMHLGGTLTTGIAFDKQTDDQELAQGSGIPIGSSTRRIPNIIVYGEVSLSNAFVDATLNNSNGIDFTRADGTTKTVNIPNTGGGTAGVTSVNGKQGVVVLDGTHINATVGNNNRSIQDHLTTIGNGLSTVNTRSITNDNRLTKLENKVPNIQVGDIISTYNTTMGDVYTAGNATFLYCGRDMAVSVNTYPQLATALGITATGNFKFPVVQDITHKYDNGARDARRRHYICAKITY